MDRQDFFAPVRYEPKRKPPRNTKGLIVAALLLCGVVVVSALGYFIYTWLQAGAAKRAEEERKVMSVEVPPAAVEIGKPLKWRELAHFDWQISFEHPRPAVVIGEFDKDGNDEVLLIDYAGKTQIVDMDGKKREVPDAQFKALAQYQAWDCDRNGVCELVPDTLFFTYQPKVKSYVRIKGTG